MAQPQAGAGVWMFDFRNRTGSVVYWLDINGNVGLTGIYFADGTVQTTAATGGGGPTQIVIESVSATGPIVVSTTANYLVLATGGSSGITLTLPSAAGIKGQAVTVKKVDTGVGSISVITTGGQTIDSTLYGTSYVLSNYMQYVTLASDGANWFIQANN